MVQAVAVQGAGGAPAQQHARRHGGGTYGERIIAQGYGLHADRSLAPHRLWPGSVPAGQRLSRRFTPPPRQVKLVRAGQAAAGRAPACLGLSLSTFLGGRASKDARPQT